MAITNGPRGNPDEAVRNFLVLRRLAGRLSLLVCSRSDDSDIVILVRSKQQ